MNYSWQEYRYCPRCGTQYQAGDFHAATTSLRCAVCGYEFFQNSSPASTAIVPSKAQSYEIILLTRSVAPGQGLLALPGGFLQYHEPPYDAVQREVFEEVLVNIDVDRLLDAYLVDYQFRGTLVSVVELVFLAKPVAFDVRTVQTAEATTVGYYDVRDFLESSSRLAFPEQQHALKCYHEYLRMKDHAVHN